MTRVSEMSPSARSTGLRREKNEMRLAGNQLSAWHGHFRPARPRNCKPYWNTTEEENASNIDCQYHKSDLHMQQNGEKQGKLS